ncbi:MAG: sensory histidine kinase AtoS [Methanocella sp. PtaU1.Bin125]|nr:MAG: sensory histidine kinase AtoS [Methanocella sp. PtaU1.Bin125]
MANARLLVVEDESIVAKDIQNRLRNLGYDVPEVVAYGDRAIERVGDLRPDLVLMDIFLKGDMDGIQAAEQIKTRYDIPVIFLTAFADPKTLERAKITGPFGYILKPFEERELLTAIEMALYKHGMEKKLKDSERWLSTTLKSVDDAIIAADTTGKVMLMNPVAEALTGWKEQESLGRDIAGVFKIVDERTGNPLPGLPGQQSQATLVARNGVRLVIECSAAPIRDDKNNVAGSVIVFRDITERRRTEEALRFTQFSVDKAADEVYWIDRDGRFSYVNEAACRALEYTREELLRLKIYDINPLETPQSWPARWGANRDRGNTAFESVHRTRSGKRYPVEIVVNYITFNNKEFQCAFARDITERKSAELALKANNRHLEIIGTITSTINRSDNTRDMLDHVVRNILELLEIDSGAVYLFDADDAAEMRLRAAVTRFEKGKNVRYRQSVPGITALDPGKVYFNEASRFLHDSPGTGTIMTVPVNVKDRVIGVIALTSSGGFERDESRELLSIGSQLGIAIENHRLFKKIQDTSNYLASIINESPDAMLTTDPEGRIVSFNRSASRLLAYTAEEVAGKPINTLLPAGSTLAPDDSKSYVREFKCKDGSLVTLNISTSKLYRDGARGGYIITLKDLSEISGLRVVPVTESNPLETKSEYHFEPGLIYLFDKRKRQDYMEIFADQVMHNIQGLCVTRQHPKKIRERYGLEKTPIIWLNSGDSAGESAIKPDNMTGLAATVYKFMAEAQDGLILLDGMEYLMMRSSYETLLKFVHYLNDRIMQSNSRAIFCIDTQTIDERQLHILMSEMEDFEKLLLPPVPAGPETPD